LIKAVVFDFGLVLSGPRAPWAMQEAWQLTGLAPERFEEVYWKFREDYDAGQLDGAAYWRKSLGSAGIVASPEAVERLVWLDGQMWCTANAPLLEWLPRLRAAGLKTAILSNMGDAVSRAIEHECAWVHDFDVRMWSHAFGCTKPGRRIFEIVLQKLNLLPDQTLFIDDRAENVEAARGLGLHAIVYSSIEQLSMDTQTMLTPASWRAGRSLGQL
jgi:putative hydrolase of the HAD superfamily